MHSESDYRHRQMFVVYVSTSMIGSLLLFQNFILLSVNWIGLLIRFVYLRTVLFVGWLASTEFVFGFWWYRVFTVIIRFCCLNPSYRPTYTHQQQYVIMIETVLSIVRLRQLEMHTWLWVDCQKPMLDDILLRSAVWLLIYLTKYHTSRFVIVLAIHSNYALEYTLDRVLQVGNTRLYFYYCSRPIVIPVA